MSKPLQKLSRDEALQKLDLFIAELDANWEREGAPWGPELLALLRDFRFQCFTRLAALAGVPPKTG